MFSKRLINFPEIIEHYLQIRWKQEKENKKEKDGEKHQVSLNPFLTRSFFQRTQCFRHLPTDVCIRGFTRASSSFLQCSPKWSLNIYICINFFLFKEPCVGG